MIIRPQWVLAIGLLASGCVTKKSNDAKPAATPSAPEAPAPIIHDEPIPIVPEGAAPGVADPVASENHQGAAAAVPGKPAVTALRWAQPVNGRAQACGV